MASCPYERLPYVRDDELPTRTPTTNKNKGKNERAPIVDASFNAIYQRQKFQLLIYHVNTNRPPPSLSRRKTKTVDLLLPDDLPARTRALLDLKIKRRGQGLPETEPAGEHKSAPPAHPHREPSMPAAVRQRQRPSVPVAHERETI